MEHEVPEMQMIIIKRGRAQEEAPHGGAWKVAFADFMTAMMAFFLVLWIVNSTNKETRSSVARYFNPIRISDTTAARKGLKDPREVDFDASASDDKAHTKSSSGQPGSGAGNGSQGSADERNGGAPSGPMDPITARDPFIVLDELAGRATGASTADGRAVSAEYDLVHEGPAPFRDPFAPPAPVLPPEAKPALRLVEKAPPAPPAPGNRRARAAAGADAAANERANADAQNVAERLRGEAETAAATPSKEGREAAQAQEATKAALEQKAIAEATSLREAISLVLREAGLGQGPKLDVRPVDEGLLISLTDDLNFGMFSIGSAEPQPRIVRAMEKIGALLAAQPGSFVVRGHTDSRAYKTRAYDNWRLSAARAQMAAYMLMRGKLDEKRIERIEGHADRAPRNTADPMAAENRRIEILLRRQK